VFFLDKKYFFCLPADYYFPFTNLTGFNSEMMRTYLVQLGDSIEAGF
jgi:hypothetical protein